jgi:hypothetical protein
MKLDSEISYGGILYGSNSYATNITGTESVLSRKFFTQVQ